MMTFAGALTLAAAAAGCGDGSAPSASHAGITGAGATFPYPLYSKWFDEYHKLRPDVQINYQSIGSGGGIRQVLAGTVDFGATDGPMSDEQLRQASNVPLHFPTTLGAVVPIYNVAGVEAGLKFTPAALAGIFLGTVKTWDDPAITGANPGVALPGRDIVVVHRSDGSGTTYVWTDYLSKVSDTWKREAGRGTSVKWPVGLGGKGNEGVSGLVKQTPYAIGYVELVYAAQNRLPFGAVQNASGAFVQADVGSVTRAAASAAAAMPDDFRVSITNPASPDAYPIASFTWLLVPSRISDPAKGTAIVSFLKWMLTDGQAMADPLSYAPLPAEVVAKELKAIERIRVGP
jgi:phosphate transport system substrate-binding protein